MSRVEVCLDYAELLEPGDDDVLVANVSDYVGAYAKLTHALHAHRPLRVIVRQRACGEWLKRAQAKYGLSRIAVTEISYRSRVEETWGVEVPDWISDEDLIASKLLDLASLRAAPGQSFEDLVLEAFWGAPFVYPRLPLGHLAELANGIDAEEWQAARAVPVARSVLDRRLDQWERDADTAGERLLVKAIQESSDSFGALLSKVHLVARYSEEVALRCLGDAYRDLAPLRLDLDALTLDRSDLDATVKQVQIYLKSLSRETTDASDLERALGQMSGLLVEELAWIEGVLNDGGVQVCRDLLDAIVRVFEPIDSRIHRRLAELELLIEPPRPSAPEEGWGVAEWLQWAVDQYLPYRFWLEANGVLDEEVAGYADRYADWLYGVFPNLIGSYERLAYRAILNLRGTMAQGETLLFVMLDNFGFRYADELRALMRAKGYGSADPVPYLSMLPSATEVSKKAMAVGEPSGFSGTAYQNIVQTTWSEEFGRKVKYLGRIGDLKALAEKKHCIYVLNYMPVDEALHSDPAATGVSHARTVRLALESLTQAIHEFAMRFDIVEYLRVVVCADHGSTLIPGDTPSVINADLVAKRVADVSHRYVSVTDQELDNLPKSVLDQCYCFRSRAHGLPLNYLAARGYGRFRKGDVASYVHGGLTPEETIVPFLSFRRARVEVRPPKLRLLDNVFRYGVKSTVRLELVNTNPLPLEQVTVEIVSPRDVAERFEVEGQIEAEMADQVTMGDARFRDVGQDIEEIRVRLTYVCGGQRQQDEYKLPVTMRRIMTSSFDFDL